ncbi:Nn.00g009050.m01.CDS01 [Neocucurbitaria sp. VM-36]
MTSPGPLNLTEVRIGYFGLCTSFANNASELTCFPRDVLPNTSFFLPPSPLLLASISLQKRGLYPLPAVASPLFLLSMIYYFIARRRGGKNKKAAKALLGISAALGLASVLTCMASAKALEGADEIIGGMTEIKSGIWLSVLLWIAATLQVVVVGYILCGMPGRIGGGFGDSSGGYSGGSGGVGGDSAYRDPDITHTDAANGYGAPPIDYPPSTQGPPGQGPSTAGVGPEMRGGYNNPHMVAADPYTGGNGGGRPSMAVVDSYAGRESRIGRGNAPIGGPQTRVPPRAAVPPTIANSSKYFGREDPYMGGGDGPYTSGGAPHTGRASPHVGGDGSHAGGGAYEGVDGPARRAVAPVPTGPAHSTGGYSNPYAAGSTSAGERRHMYTGASPQTRQTGAPTIAMIPSLGDEGRPYVRDGGLRNAEVRDTHIGRGEGGIQGSDSGENGQGVGKHLPNIPPKIANKFDPQPGASNQSDSTKERNAARIPKTSKPWRRAIPFKKTRLLKASRTATARKPLKVALTLNAAKSAKEGEAVNTDVNTIKPINDNAPNRVKSQAINAFKSRTVKPLKAEKRRTGAKPFKPKISLMRPAPLKATKDSKIPKVPTLANGLRGQEPPSWGLGPNLMLSLKAATPTTEGKEMSAWGLGPVGVSTTWGGKAANSTTATKEVKGQDLPPRGLGPSTTATLWATKWNLKASQAAKPAKAKATPRTATRSRAIELKKGMFSVSKPTKTVRPIKVPKRTKAVQPRKSVKPVKAKKSLKTAKSRR